MAVQADITGEEQVREAIAACMAAHGRIDILHNNVGASLALGDAPATELEVEAFDRLYAVNLRGMWLACKHTLPVMREQGSGSIVNISSMAAWEAYPYVGYKTTKAGVIALTHNIAMENARHGIRANVILPGLMNTPMAIEARVAAGTPGEEVIASRDPAGAAGEEDGLGLGCGLCLALPPLRRSEVHHRRFVAGRRRRERLLRATSSGRGAPQPRRRQ